MLVQRGLVRPVVMEALPLSEAARAHAVLDRAGAAGRMILKPAA